jgi:hypothetical protein
MLNKFLPQNDSAEAIAVALAEAKTARSAQAQRIAALEAGRGAALLEGGETTHRHEAALREARDEAERLEAMGKALRQKLSAAEARERRARLERLAAEARPKAEAAGKAIAKEYPRHAAAIVKLLQAERDALAAIATAERALSEAGEDAAGIAPIPRPRDFYAAPNPFVPASNLCQVITLPRHGGSEAAHGSPPLWRGDDHRIIAGAPIV